MIFWPSFQLNAPRKLQVANISMRDREHEEGIEHGIDAENQPSGGDRHGRGVIDIRIDRGAYGHGNKGYRVIVMTEKEEQTKTREGGE